MSTESRKSGRVSIGVNASTSKAPRAGPSATAASPKKMYVDGRRAYGYLTIMSETGPEISHVFGVGKTSIRIGRGSKNDIRMNARMFSRHHATLNITEEEGGLRVELLNESSQKNATRVLPYVLPQGNAVLLDNPSVFLLQGRRFKWVENDSDGNVAESLQNTCNRPIFYISEESSSSSEQTCGNVVEHLAAKAEASSESTNSPSASSSKKRRSSMNVSLQLRKAAHRHNFRSSLHQVQLSSPAKSILEEDTDADSDQRTPIGEGGEGEQPPQQSESVSARTSAAPSRRSYRVSGVENKAVAADKTASATLDESTLGISTLYAVAEEKDNSMDDGQADSVMATVVEMTPNRRSVRSSVVQVASSPMNELNQSAASDKPLSPDAGPSSPTFVSRASSGARLNKTSSTETASETPEKKSKRTSEQAVNSPRKSIAPPSSKRASTASSRRSLAEMEMSGASTEEDESQLGISGLYRTAGDSDSMMNVSEVSLITAAPTSPKVNEDEDNTDEELNDSMRSSGRGSRRSMISGTPGNSSLNKSKAVGSPAPSDVSRASSRLSNIQEMMTKEVTDKLIALKKTTRTSSTRASSSSTVAVTARQSLKVSSGPDVSSANLGDESVLGISALYRTTDQPSASAALNDSSASIAAGTSTPSEEMATGSTSAQNSRRRTYTAMSTGSLMRQAQNADVSLPVTLSRARASSRLTKTVASLEGAGDQKEKATATTPKQRESSKWSKGDITIPTEMFSTPAGSTPQPRLTRKSQVQQMEVAPTSSPKGSQTMDVTIPSNFFSTSPMSSYESRKSIITPAKALQEIAVDSPKTLEKLNSSRRVSKRVSVSVAQTEVSTAGPSTSSASAGDMSSLGISVLYKTTAEERKSKANITLDPASPEMFSDKELGGSRRSSRQSASEANASKTMDPSMEVTAGDDVSMPLFDSSRPTSRLSSNASMEVAAGTPALEKLENLFDKKPRTSSGPRRKSSRDISIPTEMFSTPLASTPDARVARKLTSTPVSTSANVTMDSPNLSQLYASPEPRVAGKKSSTRRVTFTSQEKEAEAEEAQDAQLNQSQESTSSGVRSSPRNSTMSTKSISIVSVGGAEDLNTSGEFITANNTPVASPRTRANRSKVATPAAATPSSAKKTRPSVTFDLRKATLKRNLRESAKPALPADDNANENDEELGESLETSCSLPNTPEGPDRALSDGPKRSLTPHPRAKKSTLKSATPLQPVSEDSVSMAEEDEEEEISFRGSLTAFMSPPPPGSPVRRSSRLTIVTPAKETSELVADASTPAQDKTVIGLSNRFQLFQTPEQGPAASPSSAKRSSTKPLYYSRPSLSLTKKGKGSAAKKSVSNSILDISIPEGLFSTPSTSAAASTSARSTPISKTPVVAPLNEELSVEAVREVEVEDAVKELASTSSQRRLSRKSVLESPAPSSTLPEQIKSAKKNQTLDITIPSQLFSTPLAPSSEARVTRKSINTPAPVAEEMPEESPRTSEKLNSSRRGSKRASVTQMEISSISTTRASLSAAETEVSAPEPGPSTSILVEDQLIVGVAAVAPPTADENKNKATTPKSKSAPKATRKGKKNEVPEVPADQGKDEPKTKTTTTKPKRAPKAVPIQPAPAVMEEPPAAEEEAAPAVRSRARRGVPEAPVAAKDVAKPTKTTRKEKEVVVEQSNDTENEETEQVAAAPVPKRVARKKLESKAAPAEEPAVPEEPKGKKVAKTLAKKTAKKVDEVKLSQENVSEVEQAVAKTVAKKTRAKRNRSESPVTEEAPPASTSKPAPRATRKGKQTEVVEVEVEPKAPAKPKPARKAAPTQTPVVEEETPAVKSRRAAKGKVVEEDIEEPSSAEVVEAAPSGRSRGRRGAPDVAAPVAEVPNQAKGTRKRKEAVVEQSNVVADEIEEKVEPPTKKTRGRAAKGNIAVEVTEETPAASAQEEVVQVLPPPKKTRGRGGARGNISEEVVDETPAAAVQEEAVVTVTAPKKARGRAVRGKATEEAVEEPSSAVEEAAPSVPSRARRGVPEVVAPAEEATKKPKATRKRKEVAPEESHPSTTENVQTDQVAVAPTPKRATRKKLETEDQTPAVEPVPQQEPKGRKAKQTAATEDKAKVEPTPKKTRGRAGKGKVPEPEEDIAEPSVEEEAVPAARSRARRGAPEAAPAVPVKEATKPTKTTRKRKEVVVEDNTGTVNEAEAEPVAVAPATKRATRKKVESEAAPIQVAPEEPKGKKEAKQTRTRKAAQPQPEPEIEEVAVRRTRRGKN